MQVATPPASAGAPAVPMAPSERASRGCFQFGCIHVACTYFLLIAGGMVTSMDAGLAVPDWPTSFGSLWFVRMVGNVFYEHGHRLVAQGVGLLTIVYMVWLWRTDARRWVRWLGVGLLGTVLLQGLLGGLTVLHYLPPQLSVSHGVLAQTFFCGSIATTYVISGEWARTRPRTRSRESVLLQGVAATAAGAVFLQLFLGALLRHNSGEAFEATEVFSNRMFPLHMTHWAGALAVLLAVSNLWRVVRQQFRHEPLLGRPAGWALGALGVQLALGLATLLTNMNPWIATAHVVTGAFLLGLLVLVLLRTHREVPA